MRFLADVSQPREHYRETPADLPLPNLFTGLPDHFGKQVGKRLSDNRTVPAGYDIIRQGEPNPFFYNVIDGWVMLYTLMEDGRRQILQFYPAGSIIGACITANDVTAYAAQALTPVILSSISREDIEDLIGYHPAYAIRVIRQFASDREQTFGRLASIGRQSARQRVARLLLELFVSAGGSSDAERPRIHLPLTQEHIGDATGLTGVHVNRVLRELKEDGILFFHYRKLEVMNLDALMAAAEIDPTQVRTWARRPMPQPLRTRREWRRLSPKTVLPPRRPQPVPAPASIWCGANI